MSADSVTGRFSGAAVLPGPDCHYTEVATVDLLEDTVLIHAGTSARIELSVSGALAIAEFILRNVEPE